MAAPTPPSLVSIATEGLFKAGYSSPTASQLTRAQNEFMEEIKNDLHILVLDIGGNLKSLNSKAYDVTIIGQELYPVPSDYGSDMTVTLLEGTNTGTAQAGSVGSITLESGTELAEDFVLGKYILGTGGTGVDQASQCVAYDTSTLVATLEPDVLVAFDNTTTYLIVDTQHHLEATPVWEIDRQTFPMIKGRPTSYAPIGNSTDGDIILSQPPDAVYGIQFRYYADLMVLDLTSTLMSTLYQRMRNMWTQGVYAKQLQSDAVSTDDTRANREIGIYRQMLREAVVREMYGSDINDMSVSVSPRFR